jgi:NADH:ubiquinone oxidoreductase subunit 5 (subunit L)/multisubunit Na+/H+ antiporter MnhA subunit
MVTAGIFLIIRCSFLIETSQLILTLIIFFGGLTAFISATISLMQHDIKKIIAYSTCSQLGYMFLSCGFSLYNVALYHLITHAFFKALLFLCAGSVIHSILDEQDVRKMGALKNLLPLTYSSMLLGTAAIIGFPFFSGYYSKDLILENVLISHNYLNFIMYCILILTAFLTVFYSMQLIFWVFLTSTNIARYKYIYITESSWIINTVLFCLSILSIFVGYFLFEIYSGVLASPFLGNSIFIFSFINNQSQMEFFLTLFYKNLPLINGFLGIFFILFLYKRVFYLLIFYKYKFYFIYIFFIKKWCFDILYNNIGFYVFKKAYSDIYVILDKGFLEYLGPTGFVNFFFQFYLKLFKYQKVSLYYYFFIALFFIINLYIIYIFNV